MKVFNFLFIGLGAFIFLNLNGLIYMFTGHSAFFSPIILLLCLGIGVSAFTIKRRIYLDPLFWFFLIFFCSFLVFGIISYFFKLSNDLTQFPYSILRNNLITLIIFPTFYIYSRIHSDVYKNVDVLNSISIFLFLSLLGIALMPLTGLQEHLVNASDAIQRNIRSSGFFANPNEAGVLANFSTVWFFYHFLIVKGWKKIMILIAFFISIYVAFISFSKSAMIMSLLLIFFCALHLFFFKKRKTKLEVTALAGFLVVICILIFNLNSIIQYATRHLSQKQIERIVQVQMLMRGNFNPETTTLRSSLYTLSLKKIKKNPIFGHGLGSFHKFENNRYGAHNTYLMILGESGIIPFILFITFILSFLAKISVHPNYHIRFLSYGTAIVLFLQISMTSHYFFRDRIAMALLAVIISLISSKNIEKR